MFTYEVGKLETEYEIKTCSDCPFLQETGYNPDYEGWPEFIEYTCPFVKETIWSRDGHHFGDENDIICKERHPDCPLKEA